MTTGRKRYLSALAQTLRRASGQRHHGLLIDNNQGAFSFTSAPLVESLSIVDNDDDLGYAKATDQSNATIFNTWTKISRQSSAGDADPFSDNAVPEERDAFTYDADTDTISNPLNTKSLVGFISPDSFSDYVLDVQVTSTSQNENDPIGLCIGYATDSDGTTHTLTVMRLMRPYDVYGPDAFNVVVDLRTAGRKTIVTTNEGLTWIDGSPATGPGPTEEDLGMQVYRYNPWGDNPNGIRYRVTRAGDQFTVETTQYNGTEFIPEATLTFSLDDDPSLSRFKGQSRYGFVSLSQELANWKALQRPVKASQVLDLRTNTRHLYQDGTWVESTVDLNDYVRQGQLYFNPTSRKVFHLDGTGSLRQLLSVS